jgi:hypothetical protein
MKTFSAPSKLTSALADEGWVFAAHSVGDFPYLHVTKL